jgi:hypothetical protein
MAEAAGHAAVIDACVIAAIICVGAAIFIVALLLLSDGVSDSRKKRKF